MSGASWTGHNGVLAQNSQILSRKVTVLADLMALAEAGFSVARTATKASVFLCESKTS